MSFRRRTDDKITSLRRLVSDEIRLRFFIILPVHAFGGLGDLRLEILRHFQQYHSHISRIGE